MDFTPDEAGVDLARELRAVLDGHLAGTGVRKIDTDDSARQALRSDVIEQGVSAVLIPEDADGLGLGWGSAVHLIEEFGRSAAPAEFLDSIVLVPGIYAQFGDAFASQWASLADGTRAVGLIDMHGRVVSADRLDAFLVRRNSRLQLFAASEVVSEPAPSVDDRAHASRVEITGSPLLTVDLDDESTQRVEAAGYLVTAAGLIGTARRILTLTSEYVAVREQFGRPIGAFQAIQQPLAEVALKIEFAAPLVHAAAWELDGGRPSALFSACHAKAAAVAAATSAWRTGLQSHGAIGYTEEYDLQIWLKRSITLSHQHGTAYDARRVLRSRLLGASVDSALALV